MLPTPETKAARTKEDEADQRVAIRYFYRRLDSPPEEDWDGQCGTVSAIRKAMGDSPPGSATVRRTLERIAEDDTDLRVRIDRGGRSHKLSHEDDILIGLMLCEGYSQRVATDMLNQELAAKPIESVLVTRVLEAVVQRAALHELGHDEAVFAHRAVAAVERRAPAHHGAIGLQRDEGAEIPVHRRHPCEVQPGAVAAGA